MANLVHYNELYRLKVLLNNFHLNGHTQGFLQIIINGTT